MSAVSAYMDQSNDLLWGSDRQIGPAYQLAVAREPSSAVISFRVDPGKLASAVEVAHATPVGLYIQIFEPALGSWIPLKSVYHAASHTVMAVAPHLSLVSLAWSGVKCVVTCTVAFVKAVKRFGSDMIGNIKDAWSPAQEHDDCAADADKNWSVRSSISKLSGCVVTPGSSPAVQGAEPLAAPDDDQAATWSTVCGGHPAAVGRQPASGAIHLDDRSSRLGRRCLGHRAALVRGRAAAGPLERRGRDHGHPA